MTTLEEAKDRILGKVGTPKRDQYEKELKEELSMSPFLMAKQMIEEYLPWIKTSDTEYESRKQNEYYYHIAKECAIINVNRIQQALIDYGINYLELHNMQDVITYWEEVKKEIQNMEL